MYIKHCKLSKNKQLKLIEHFVAGTSARTAAALISVHRNTATKFFSKLRQKIAQRQEDRGKKFSGKIELDESYFGPLERVKEGEALLERFPFLFIA